MRCDSARMRAFLPRARAPPSRPVTAHVRSERHTGGAGRLPQGDSEPLCPSSTTIPPSRVAVRRGAGPRTPFGRRRSRRPSDRHHRSAGRPPPPARGAGRRRLVLILSRARRQVVLGQLGQEARCATTTASISAIVAEVRRRRREAAVPPAPTPAAATPRPPVELQNQVNNLKVEADDELKRAPRTSTCPSEATDAQRDVLLDARAPPRRRRADRRAAPARARRHRTARPATQRIAGEMRNFDASDVIWSPARHAADHRRRCATPGSRSAARAADRRQLGLPHRRRLARPDLRRRPARSGSGGVERTSAVDARHPRPRRWSRVSAGTTTLTTAGDQPHPGHADADLPVKIQNQGQNDETQRPGAASTLTGSGQPITATQDDPVDDGGPGGDGVDPAAPRRRPRAASLTLNVTVVCRCPARRRPTTTRRPTRSSSRAEPALVGAISSAAVHDLTDTTGHRRAGRRRRRGDRADPRARARGQAAAPARRPARRARRARSRDLVAHAADAPARLRRAARLRRGRARPPARPRWTRPRGGSTARSPTARWSATTPTARCPASSRRRSRCSTSTAPASCSPRSTTATRRGSTPSRSRRPGRARALARGGRGDPRRARRGDRRLRDATSATSARRGRSPRRPRAGAVDADATRARALPTIHEVVMAVQRGELDRGLVPIENALEPARSRSRSTRW